MEMGTKEELFYFLPNVQLSFLGRILLTNSIFSATKV